MISTSDEVPHRDFSCKPPFRYVSVRVHFFIRGIDETFVFLNFLSFFSVIIIIIMAIYIAPILQVALGALQWKQKTGPHVSHHKKKKPKNKTQLQIIHHSTLFIQTKVQDNKPKTRHQKVIQTKVQDNKPRTRHQKVIQTKIQDCKPNQKVI